MRRWALLLGLYAALAGLVDASCSALTGRPASAPTSPSPAPQPALRAPHEWPLRPRRLRLTPDPPVRRVVVEVRPLRSYAFLTPVEGSSLVVRARTLREGLDLLEAHLVSRHGQRSELLDRVVAGGVLVTGPAHLPLAGEPAAQVPGDRLEVAA